MDTFINEDARLAVKKGINWLDTNYPNWASRINLAQLGMSDCQNCVIGQAVGNYSSTTRQAAGGWECIGSRAAWAIEHGFEASFPGDFPNQKFKASYGYKELDMLWSEEVRKRLRG